MELKRCFAGMGEMCRGQCSEHFNFNWCVPIYIIVNSVGWELVLGGCKCKSSNLASQTFMEYSDKPSATKGWCKKNQQFCFQSKITQ